MQPAFNFVTPNVPSDASPFKSLTIRMDNDQSDVEDDPGRRESERRLKNNMNSKYLDEVIEKSGMDYEEAVEAIERERKARDALADGLLSTYGMEVRTDSVDLATRHNHTMPVRPKPASDEVESFVKAREADKAHTKDLLAAGKRVAADEMSTVERNGAPKEVLQFKGMENGHGAGSSKVLKSMQKGVKEATKGMQEV